MCQEFLSLKSVDTFKSLASHKSTHVMSALTISILRQRSRTFFARQIRCGQEQQDNKIWLKKTEVTFRGFKRKNWIKLDLQSAGSGDFSVSPMSKSSKISMNFSSAGDLARGLVCLWNQSMAAQDSMDESLQGLGRVRVFLTLVFTFESLR